MKKYFCLFFIAAFAVLLTSSCSESDDAMAEAKFLDPKFQKAFKDSTVTDYPMAIDEFVTSNYPQDTIEEVELDSLGNFEVELSNGTELLFDSVGTFLEVLPEDDDEGSEEDSDEDDSNEDDSNEDDADEDEYDEDDSDEDDADEEDSDEDEYDEMITEYPAAIDSYIAANHPGTTIEEIEMEDDGSFEVELDDDTEIVFDSEGNFVEYGD